VLGLIYAILKWKKYKQFDCRIWEKDGFGQWRETTDGAGIFVDKKTQNKRFFLRKNNVGLEPDNVPYIPAGGRKVVYLLCTGLKNFRFIKINVGNPNITLDVGEEDVNWAINAYERQKKIFNRDLFMQYLPFAILAFVCVIILIIFIYFFKNFDVLKDVAVALKEAAKEMARAKAGTVIIE